MTYCGKNCETCSQREALSCPGCENGPGRWIGGDCDIAQCCREKGHASCQTCTIGQSGCGKWRGCETAPEHRRQLLERRAARRAEAAAHAQVLGKWLWLAFWLIVPNAVAAFMTMDAMAEAVPALQLPGEILQAICGGVYAYALWQLKDIWDSYRTAGIARFVHAGFILLGLLIPEERVGLVLLASLPAIGLMLLADYNEFMGHAAVLAGVDDELSEKWKKLWDWNVKLLLAMLGSFLVILILPLLGALVMLVAAIGVLVVSVMKLTYLYRMAKLFREWKDPA